MNHYGVGHTIVSTLIHGLIYSAIWKVMRTLSVPEALALAGVVLAIIVIATILASSFEKHRNI